jgi:16S rRNA (cytosine1407-C5)-methyltransferase
VKKEKEGAGSQAFHDYYRGIYGGRWPDLLAALAGSSRPCGLRVLDARGPLGLGYELLPPDAADGPSSQPGTEAGTATYWLDEASVAAALALPLPEEGQVLDACAAPGGKSLVLAARMGPGVRLLANELSADRRRRLSAVLDSSLPPSVRQRVSVFGADAASLCLRRPGAFDAILLDAPCSSERHVLADPGALAAWTPSRPRALARRQWALLSSAFIMLKEGGHLVYSTCSINPEENDGVAARLVAKAGDSLVVERPELAGAEETALGSLILPDRAQGSGPIYVFRARKARA